MKTIIFEQYMQFVKLKCKAALNIIRITKRFDSFSKGVKEYEKKRGYGFGIGRMYGSGAVCGMWEKGRRLGR